MSQPTIPTPAQQTPAPSGPVTGASGASNQGGGGSGGSSTGGIQRGIVKMVMSGDTIIVRGPPKDGPPPERTIGLSNIQAPRLSRRPMGDAVADIKDEPYAWEAREYLRKKVVGKEVCFTVEYKSPTGKEFGCVYLGKDTSSESLTDGLVAEGLAEVRRGGLKPNDENQQKLVQLEETAKASGKGKWGPPEELAQHVRDIKWNLDNPRHFVESNKNKEIDAVIEHVRDGCTVRAFLLPSYQYVTVMLSGIKCPMFKMDDDKSTKSEPFAEQAKYFTEVRLLQKDVKIVLEGASNQNLLGTVQHPNGNISELLLQEGFAHCADWSMKNVTTGVERMRMAEKSAKDKKLRVWQNFQATSHVVNIKDRNFTAKVVEIVNGDSLNVKLIDGTTKKIFLASIKPPRPTAEGPVGEGESAKRPGAQNSKTARSRPLYDIPYMFEAREFLRKKLITKKVNVQVDYVQPKSPEFPEKVCCTVTINEVNVAEALVSKGLATVIRYRQGDDQRSSCYDDLLKAEDRAEKKGVGVHSKKESPMIRVADVSGDVQKAKQFLPFLQRAGKVEALVEFVASGSRLRLYIPKETCLITFLLSGIECPHGSRLGPNGQITPGDPFGDEAHAFTKDLVLQREVDVEVESMDKGGNFIGWLYVDGMGLSTALVEEGLAKVHFTAERGNHYKSLVQAESKAKEAKKNVWTLYEEPKEEIQETEVLERKINYQTVIITEITNELHLYAQNAETGPALVTLMEQLRSDLNANPPLPGAYTPKKGDLCAAKFTDGEWYRARVDRVAGNKVSLTYIDYGNKEDTTSAGLAVLESKFQQLPAQAHEYALACIVLPKDEDDKLTAMEALSQEITSKQYELNVEYRAGGLDYATLQYSVGDGETTKEDIGQTLISEGYVLVEGRKEKRLAKLIAQYKKAEEKAKEARKNLWRYGDFTEDDTKEFGYKQ